MLSAGGAGSLQGGLTSGTSLPYHLLLLVFPVTSQAVTALVKNFPKHMASSMQQILPSVWNTLTESAALYPFWERAGAGRPRGWASGASGLTFPRFRLLRVSARGVGVCHAPL